MKKRFMWHTTLVVIALIAFSNCNDDKNCIDGSGPIVTEEFDLEEFDSFSAAGPKEILVRQGAEQRVVVSGQQNIIDRLERDVTAGVWNAELENGCYEDFDLSVEITLPDLKSAEAAGATDMTFLDFDSLTSVNLGISGSGNITQTGAFNASEYVDLRITGAGNALIGVYAPRFNYIQTGSGNATINGEVRLQSMAIDGAGNYSAPGLLSDTCNIAITGSGNATVHAEEFLFVRITGSGSVFYTGFPDIDSQITGSGSLIDSN